MTDTHRNRVAKGVSTGGQFAKEQASEATGGTGALGRTAAHRPTRIGANRAENLDRQIEQAERFLGELRVAKVREDLADIARSLPDYAAVINVITWEDESAEDGSFDITLGDVVDTDGDFAGHCQDYTIRMEPGSATSPDGWDTPFRLDNEDDNEDGFQLDVAKIRDWDSPTGSFDRRFDQPPIPSAPFFAPEDSELLEYVPPLPEGAPHDTRIEHDSTGNEHTVTLLSGDRQKIASYRYADSGSEWLDNVEEFECGPSRTTGPVPDWMFGREDEVERTLRQVARNADFASDRAQSRLRFAPGFRESVTELATAGNPAAEQHFRVEYGLD